MYSGLLPVSYGRPSKHIHLKQAEKFKKRNKKTIYDLEAMLVFIRCRYLLRLPAAGWMHVDPSQSVQRSKQNESAVGMKCQRAYCMQLWCGCSLSLDSDRQACAALCRRCNTIFVGPVLFVLQVPRYRVTKAICTALGRPSLSHSTGTRAASQY